MLYSRSDSFLQGELQQLMIPLTVVKNEEIKIRIRVTSREVESYTYEMKA